MYCLIFTEFSHAIHIVLTTAAIVSGLSAPITQEKLLELLERRTAAAAGVRPPAAPPAAPKTPASPTAVQSKPNLLAKR